MKDEKIIRVYYADGPAKTYRKCPPEEMSKSERMRKKTETRHICVKIDGKKDPRNRTFRDFEDVREHFSELKANGYYVGYRIVFPIDKNNTYEE